LGCNNCYNNKRKNSTLGYVNEVQRGKSNVSDSSQPSLEVIGLGHVDQKDGKDVNIQNVHMFLKNPMFEEDIAKVEKIEHLKHEV